MSTARSSEPPTTAVGVALVAIVVAIAAGVGVLIRRGSVGAGEVRPVCARPLEVIDERGSRLACADDLPWRVCALAAGDQVRDGVCRPSGEMAAAMRLVAGVPLNLNRATASDLELLDGIGPALAAAIVADRAQHGPFTRVEDLERVRGIGPRTVQRLRATLAAGPP